MVVLASILRMALELLGMKRWIIFIILGCLIRLLLSTVKFLLPTLFIIGQLPVTIELFLIPIYFPVFIAESIVDYLLISSELIIVTESLVGLIGMILSGIGISISFKYNSIYTIRVI